jgi:hypothetical protein
MSGAHSKVGASSADRWMACPGSVRMSKDLPNYTTRYAAEGTAAHRLAEQCYVSGMQPATFLGSIIHVDDEAAKRAFEIPVDQEMVDGVNVYLDTIRALTDTDRVMGQARAEVRFHLKSIHDDLFGTGDFVHFSPATKVLHVLDFKYGAGTPVEVKNNSQLKYYALGALLELNVGAQKVVFGVVQPRCPHKDGPVRMAEIDAMELMDYADELLQAVKRTEDPFAPLVSGDHCKWCPAAAICPELTKKAMHAAQSKFKPAPGLPYDKAELAKHLGELDMIEGWCKSVREFAYNEAERGEELPGWKLVAKRATRKWEDPLAARAWLLAKGYNKTDIETLPELKSPAQIEKVIDKAAVPDLKQFVKSESSGHALVPADDKRSAVKPAVAEVFKPQTA